MTARWNQSRYEVLERVGDGTFFQVVKARDKAMNRVVVLKVPQPNMAADSAFCEALRASISEVTNLTHPNIARVYEVGEGETGPFLVTEYVRGMNLKERIRRIAPFTLSVAVDFAIAIGEALQHAHSAGVVHGDLRPENVVISPEGAVKVTDFGMAPVLAASPQAAASNLGRAVHYQAPEVATGAGATPSVDIYALGVILYEMVTGALPYSGETPVMTAMRHQTEPVPSPRMVNPGVPRSLEGVVMKALQKRPQERYLHVSDMLNDLKSIRDALRFGKSLSWSPMEADRTISSVKAAAPTPGAAATPVVSEPAPRAEVPASGGAARMSSIYATDDGVPSGLKIVLSIVAGVFLTVLIVGVGLWMSFAKGQDAQKFPHVVGMNIDQAKAAAEKINVRLIEHDEYNDRYDNGIVYRSEWEADQPIKAGRSVNVWVSKGSRMVWVPEITKLAKDDAEAKLKAAGLVLGSVNRTFDNSVPFDCVVSQNPRAGKRVSRDVPINLTLSDGPKVEGDGGASAPDQAMPPDTSTDTGATDTGGAASAGDDTPSVTTLTVRVPRDGLGTRRVRVEYDDARGTHSAVDEYHGESDRISQKVEVYGGKITVRVFYGDSSTPVSQHSQKIRTRSR